jgi:hypothetical protein
MMRPFKFICHVGFLPSFQEYLKSIGAFAKSNSFDFDPFIF